MVYESDFAADAITNIPAFDPALYGGTDRGGISTLTAARDAERRKLDEAMTAWEAAIAALDRP